MTIRGQSGEIQNRVHFSPRPEIRHEEEYNRAIASAVRSRCEHEHARRSYIDPTDASRITGIERQIALSMR
jgi:hypothetical protein